jgi:hypothetical protein
LRSGGFWVAVFGLLLGVGLAWLLITGLLARREVSKAESAINGARASISAGDITTAIGQSDQIRAHAHRAHELTTGPAWWIASKIPLLGKPVVSVRGCATAADALGNQVLQPLVRTAGSLNLNQLVDHGTVNVQPLAQAAPVVSAARLNLIAASAIVGDLPQSTWLGTVDRARASFHTSLTKLQGQLNSLDRVTSILPQMLGTDRTMHYFVGLENEAESRGVGGIPGAFAIVTADRGKLSFTRFESDTTLYRVRTDLKLGAEYNQRYGVADPTSTYANSTISPDFRDAAQIWAAMWQKYSGQKVDGAIAIDPTAISYLLKVTGPAELADGTSVGADQSAQGLSAEDGQRDLGSIDQRARLAGSHQGGQQGSGRTSAAGVERPTVHRGRTPSDCGGRHPRTGQPAVRRLHYDECCGWQARLLPTTLDDLSANGLR